MIHFLVLSGLWKANYKLIIKLKMIELDVKLKIHKTICF